MPVVCPTITAYDPHDYRQQMEVVSSFAVRVHIDLMDGIFAPTVSPGLRQLWWPENVSADIHLMYQRPADYLGDLINLRPNLVVIHKEADVDHSLFAAELHKPGIKAGLALLHDTPAEDALPLLYNYDQVLIFSGDLGRQGGTADLSLSDKIKVIRAEYPAIEIAWDGGINDQNARQLVEAGVDVLNVGGYIAKADNPQEAYAKLESVIS